MLQMNIIEIAAIGNKAVIIHNGLDMTLYKNKYDNELIRKELGVKPEDVLVCIIGRIVSWKGHEYFIKAISHVANKIPEHKRYYCRRYGR